MYKKQSGVIMADNHAFYCELTPNSHHSLNFFG